MQEDIERFLKLTNKLTMRNILLPILIILLFPVFNSCEENNDKLKDIIPIIIDNRWQKI